MNEKQLLLIQVSAQFAAALIVEERIGFLQHPDFFGYPKGKLIDTAIQRAKELIAKVENEVDVNQ